MVCEHCGASFNKPTAKFCSKCGTRKKIVSLARKNNLQQDNDDFALPNVSKTATFKLDNSSKNDNNTNFVSNDVGGGVGSGCRSDGHHKSPAFSDAIPHALPATVPFLLTRNEEDTQDSVIDEDGTLCTTPEEEAKYSAWATLGPGGITPEMLQTNNSDELKSWRRGCLIGRGTYGSVYLGLLDDGFFYAVKCVELGGKTGTFSVKELTSLSREISMMQRLQHKNLCTFKGVLYDAPNKTICMFMEYIGGGSLSSLVKQLKPLPPNVVRRWTRQLLSGLLYLHTQRIIHRDIKGDNLLVDVSSSPKLESQIKLVDFGAARRLSDAVARSRTVIGTPYWMAPEVVDVTGSGEGYSYKADVWSVGCTVAEMLTGKPPWPSNVNAAAAIMMIAQSKGGPTEIPEAEATPGCLDFMRKCFVCDPEQRPTVEELMQHPWIIGEME